MDDAQVKSLSMGLSQKGVRDHNERLILSLIQRLGGLPGSALAKLADLSPPTVFGILRQLEADGLIERGTPVRGKVGKPSIPMGLAANGAFAFGIKIGRRSADLILMDFKGGTRGEMQITYDYPIKQTVLAFLQDGLLNLTNQLSASEQARICGIGVAAPFEFWNWNASIDAPSNAFRAWREVDLVAEIGAFSDLPVIVMNDATAACQAEHTYGRGKEFQDYAYFFIGAFIGGGVVLNNSVYVGRQGNAGALGSIRSISPIGESMQLIDMASIHLLEARLHEVDIETQQLWDDPDSWTRLTRYVEPWLLQTAQELAKASLSACSVIDFEAILIDGSFPASLRDDLVNRVRRYVATQDTRGLIPPKIEAGSIGANARSQGAACEIIRTQFFLKATTNI
ncbi:MAG: ROK family transcriptional regulator [Planktomarina sp.]|uniref:ROK family transcriptional regulator n=1 Tax=Planktomarina sp. TaxID=2024851 RepID=UPI0032613030|nr:ROK family transcriptional regulator [Planktomarina sp.]